MAYRRKPLLAIHLASESSRLTHNHPDAQDACRYLAALTVGALGGAGKAELGQPLFKPVENTWLQHPLTEEMELLARGSFHEKPAGQIRSSAHAVRCLEAALWAFFRTDTFAEGLLLVVNMGDDSDTTGAVYGQLAGAYYGVDGIPGEWLRKLAEADLIRDTALSLLGLSQNL
jgi:ADP-ribosylglycohydrolase